MAHFIKLAAKNVFRNKRRTIITTLVLVFGAAALLIAGGFIGSSFRGLSENTIKGQLGHIQIYNKDYFSREEEKPLELGLNDEANLKAQVGQIPGVRFSMARIEFNGLISNGDKSSVFIGRGMEAKLEKELSGTAVNLRSGNFLGESPNDDGTPEILLASGLAKNLKANPGDILTLMATTAKGALNAMDVRVTGIYTTGIPEYDERGVLVNLKDARSLLMSTKMTKLVVVLEKTALTRKVAGELEAKIPNITIKRWDELATFYKSVVQLYTAIFVFLGLIIFIVVILSCSNTMMMSIFERTREIGTQLAVGTSPKRLLSMFLYEGLLIGVIGGGIGLALAGIVTILINAAHIVLPPPPGSTNGYAFIVDFIPVLYVGVFCFIVVMTTAATVLPAVKASRLKIVDALGHI